MKIYGNVVAPEDAGYGYVEIADGKIDDVVIESAVRKDAQWVVPGFIDVHLHGMFDGEALAGKVHIMAEKAPSTGLVRFCPATGSEDHQTTMDFLERCKELVRSPGKNTTLIAGSHLEGPYIDFVHRGGMHMDRIRLPQMDEVDKFLKAADGTLKIMTISPELPKASEVIKKLVALNIRMSAGHTGMSIEQAKHFADIGGRGVCHICDTFDGRKCENGVVQPSMMDAVLLDDRLFIELISDGVHVPPMMVEVVKRMAGAKRIMGITDSMMGAGMNSTAIFETTGNKFYHFKNGVFRVVDGNEDIVGSGLTMNVAFYNFSNLCGFTPVEAAWMTSGNAARYLGIDHFTGSLKKGLNADIAILENDMKSVSKTIIGGEVVYE